MARSLAYYEHSHGKPRIQGGYRRQMRNPHQAAAVASTFAGPQTAPGQAASVALGGHAGKKRRTLNTTKGGVAHSRTATISASRTSED